MLHISLLGDESEESCTYQVLFVSDVFSVPSVFIRVILYVPGFSVWVMSCFDLKISSNVSPCSFTSCLPCMPTFVFVCPALISSTCV